MSSGVPLMNFDSIANFATDFQNARREQKLANLGEQIGLKLKVGDYTGLAHEYLGAGDSATGLALLKLGQAYDKDRRIAGNDALVGNALGALGGGGSGYDAPTERPSSGMGPLGSTSGLPSFVDQGAPSSSYVASLFKRESGGNPAARTSTSSATGLGQFTDRTWAGVSRRHPELGLTPGGRTDPAQMTRATQAHTADNAELLRRSDLPVNDASLYALHFLGSGGGRRFVGGTMANPDRPAVSLVSPEQAAANRNVFYDRSGRPRTAGEVFGSFERSFGGRGGGASARTASAEPSLFAQDAAGAQILEQPGAMMPVPRQPAQYASLPGSDVPVQGINPDAARAMRPLSNPVPSANSDGRMNTGANRSGLPALPTLPSIGSSDPSRAMTMPGEGSTQVAQLGGQAPQTRGDAVVAQQIPQLQGMGSGARVQNLLRLSALELSDGPRQAVQTVLKQALDDAKLPDNVKAYLWARGAGLTQARSLGEFEREGKGAQIVAPGSSVLAPDGQSVAFTTPDRDTVGNQVAARQAAAAELGLAPNSPAYQSYVLTGKMPREDAQPLTASDKKAILDADDGVATAEGVIANLQQAKAVSRKAYEGPTAGYRGMATGYFGNEAGLATTDLDNLVTTNALSQLKAIFGAAPTEGERKILLDIQGSSSLPDAARQRIYDRGIALAQRRLELNRERAAELRGQTYYRPGGGPDGSRQAPAPRSSGPTSVPPAPPAPAADYLRANPSLRGAFDEKYGAGSADRVLGGR